MQVLKVNLAGLRLLLAIALLFAARTGLSEQCGLFLTNNFETSDEPYSKVIEPTLSPRHLQDLPGFTRSVYKSDHALITPESHVFASLPGWLRTTAAYFISPATGSHFTMFLAKMEGDSSSGLPAVDTERLLFVIKGDVELFTSFEGSQKLSVDSFVYLPPNFKHTLQSESGATIVAFERRYQKTTDKMPEMVVGSTYSQPVIETPGEVFVLRKLLPTSEEYDFNIHVMDFEPGDFLNVKEIHYNQHGLLMLEGRGIYRLGDNWYPVQAGDAIWMAPFVPQWYGALGRTRTRYLLYKDVNRDPLLNLN